MIVVRLVQLLYLEEFVLIGFVYIIYIQIIYYINMKITFKSLVFFKLKGL